MNPAERVIQAFGGITATAKALGHTNPSTVQGWKQRGIIPARQQAAILSKAAELGIDLSPADLVMSAPGIPSQKGARNLQLKRDSKTSNASLKKRSSGSKTSTPSEAA